MRSWLCRLVLVVVICASAAFAQSEKKAKNPPANQSSDPVAKSLVEMERQWAEVCTTRDTSVLERILADDFLGTNVDGKLYTKSEDIEKIAKSRRKALWGRIDDVKYRFFSDDVAVLYGVETCMKSASDHKEEAEVNIWTDTWLKRSGRWQIVAAQDMRQTSAAPTAAAPSQSVLIEDLTWMEVRDAIAARKTTAIYYAGSTEQNGPHMALGKHNFIARYVSQRIAEELGNALVYPVMPYGPTGDIATKTNHMRFPGSISVSEGTFGAVAREVALSAIAAGFKNVVLMGDHGGDQEALKKVAEALDSEWSSKRIRVYYIPDLYYKEKEQMREYLTKRNMAIDEHAGIDDTSEVMFIDRDNKWIRKDKLVPDDGKMGVEGDPTRASAELGKMFINWKIQDAVAQIRSSLASGVPPASKSGSPSTQSQSGPNVEEEIARIDDERRNAYLQNDAATLDRILADDVTAVAGIGTEDDKASILADVRSHDLTYKRLTYDHRKIRIYGDTAVVTSHAKVVANYKGRDLSGKLLVTRVYAKQQGSWKLVAIQSTRIPA